MQALTAIILFCKISWKVHPNIQEKYENICVSNIITCNGDRLSYRKTLKCIKDYTKSGGRYEESN